LIVNSLPGPDDKGSGHMEAKYPVAASVKTAVRNGIELIIVLAIILPLAVIFYNIGDGYIEMGNSYVWIYRHFIW
jgi:hypothetical protein